MRNLVTSQSLTGLKSQRFHFTPEKESMATILAALLNMGREITPTHLRIGANRITFSPSVAYLLTINRLTAGHPTTTHLLMASSLVITALPHQLLSLIAK